MADLITLAVSRPIDWAGDISPGAKATFYLSGTTTLASVWQDQAGTIPHASPVVADGDGVFPPVFSGASLKAIITDADDVELPGSPLDPCPRTLTTQSGAGTIPFSPTEDIPADNVQAAIERVQANQNEGLESAGVGVTTAPLLASIDATNLTSGRFRYDGTTTGTFPAGVTAADTGTVILSAGASGNMLMELTSKDGLVSARRTMQALVLGDWGFQPIGKANTAEAKAATNDTKFMTPASTKEQVAIKAWVNFNGTGVPAIRASNNIASVTDSGVGKYTVTFTTPFADTNYAVIASNEAEAGVAFGWTGAPASGKLVGSCVIETLASGGGAIDREHVQVMFLGA